MSKWEYAVVKYQTTYKGGMFGSEVEELYFHAYDPSKESTKYKSDQLDALIRKLGNDGWELVSVTESRNMISGNFFDLRRLYFKKLIE